MISTITHRTTLGKGHDPRNSALSIIFIALIITFLVASFFLYFAVGQAHDYTETQRDDFFFLAAVFLLISIPPVLAYVGIEKRIPSLVIPMIVLVYTFSAIVHLGSIWAFARMIYDWNYNISTYFFVFTLGLGLNLVFFIIGAINHCAFFYTYAFLKKSLRDREQQAAVDEAPVISKFSQGV